MISINEFRATVNEDTFAFHITNPITIKTIDNIVIMHISYLKNYFMRFPYDIKIITMNLSSASHLIMHSLFPHAQIIADKFHYTRIVRKNMVQARISY